MSDSFFPVLGLVGSVLFSTLMRPSTPKAPAPAPVPPPPAPAPLPAPPVAPVQEPSITPENAQATEAEKQRAIKRRTSSATSISPLDIQDQQGDSSSITFKSLLGE